MALQLKLDPTGVEAGAAKAKAALATITGEAVKTESALESIGRTGTVAPINRAATAIEQVGARSGATTGAARMLGQQLSQVAQQGAVTGNYLGALAVQLPDMALGFGNIAIAASIVATVAMPLLIQQFGNGKSAADQLADANEALGDSISSMSDIADTSLETLRKKYGEVDAELLKLIGHQLEQQTMQAQNAARDAVKSLADEYQITGNAISLFAATGRGALADVAKELNLSKNATIAFASAVREAEIAKTFGEQAAAMAKVDGYLQRSAINGSELANGVTEAALALREAEEASARASGNINQMPGALGAAATAAGGLAGQMGNVAMAANAALAQMIAMDETRRAMQSAAQRQAAAPGGIGPAGMGDGGAAYPSMAERQRAEAEAAKARLLAAPRFVIPRSGGGGGGGGSSVAELSEAEKAQIKLNDAIAKGTDAYGQFQSAAGNAIDKLISGTGNLKSALRDMAKEMALALMQGQLLQHISGATPGMSIGQMLVKGIFSGFHDGGGRIGLGQSGIVGENGPEVVSADRNGAMVTSRADTARMMGGQQNVHVTVGVTVDQTGNLQAYVKNVAQAAGSQAVQTVKRSLNGWNSQLATDGALA